MKSLAIALLIASTTAAGGAAYVSMTRSDEALDRLAKQEAVIADLADLTEKLEARLAEAEKAPRVTNWVIDGETRAVAEGSTPTGGTLRPSDPEGIASAAPADAVGDVAMGEAGADDRVFSADVAGGDEAAKDRMRALLSEIRDEEEQAEQARRRDRRMQRIEERVKSYSERLHLQPAQEEEMIAVMSESMEARSAIFQQVREGTVERSDVRKMMDESRAETDAEMQIILTSDQYEEYQKIRAEEDQSRGDRRRGFGRGGGSSTNSSSGGGSDRPATDRADNGGR